MNGDVFTMYAQKKEKRSSPYGLYRFTGNESSEFLRANMAVFITDTVVLGSTREVKNLSKRVCKAMKGKMGVYGRK